MDTIPVYHKGSSIALLFRIKNRSSDLSHQLDRYEADAIIYTRLLGYKIRRSTKGSAENLIYRLSGDILGLNITADETRGLTAGNCAVKLTLTHTPTGTVRVITKKILILEETIE